MELVLASTSPYRRELLERLGVSFRCRASGVDERALQRQAESADIGPRELATRLAEAKALSLRDVEPGATLIGCDQLVACGGRIFGKPGDLAAAADQLAALAGRPHELITALAVWHAGRLFEH